MQSFLFHFLDFLDYKLAENGQTVELDSSAHRTSSGNIIGAQAVLTAPAHSIFFTGTMEVSFHSQSS